MERAIHTVKSAWAPRAIPPEPSRTHSTPSGILTASSLLRTSTKMCCVSPCLTETSFHQMISWAALKFHWQKFAQNRKAKAPQPADSCCTRSPPGRSGSALTCSFLSKKLSCRGLRDLPKRLGLETDGAAPGLKEHLIASSIMGHARRAQPSILLHTKLLAIYANMIFPRNKPNPQHSALY